MFFNLSDLSLVPTVRHLTRWVVNNRDKNRSRGVGDCDNPLVLHETQDTASPSMEVCVRHIIVCLSPDPLLTCLNMLLNNLYIFLSVLPGWNYFPRGFIEIWKGRGSSCRTTLDMGAMVFMWTVHLEQSCSNETTASRNNVLWMWIVQNNNGTVYGKRCCCWDFSL